MNHPATDAAASAADAAHVDWVATAYQVRASRGDIKKDIYAARAASEARNARIRASAYAASAADFAARLAVAGTLQTPIREVPR